MKPVEIPGFTVMNVDNSFYDSVNKRDNEKRYQRDRDRIKEVDKVRNEKEFSKEPK
jgi:hypothetical protein